MFSFLCFLRYAPINHFPFTSLLQGIIACFPEVNLRTFQTLCPVNVEVISFSCGHFLRAGGMLYCLSRAWQSERKFTADRPNKGKQSDRDRRNKHFFFLCFVDRATRYTHLTFWHRSFTFKF